jgi:hemerythrin superfamily protein
MRTNQTTNKAGSKQVPASTEEMDAIALLTDDHDKVRSMFEQYEGLGDRAHATKQKLAAQICTELIKHMMAEEEIFYPAFREADQRDEDLVDEAVVEHASAKDLIEQILSMDSTDELYDAKVKVLSEMIEHHVKEEEEEMFPKARKLKQLDLEALGQEIQQRKDEIDIPLRPQQ